MLMQTRDILFSCIAANFPPSEIIRQIRNVLLNCEGRILRFAVKQNPDRRPLVIVHTCFVTLHLLSVASKGQAPRDCPAQITECITV